MTGGAGADVHHGLRARARTRGVARRHPARGARPVHVLRIAVALVLALALDPGPQPRLSARAGRRRGAAAARAARPLASLHLLLSDRRWVGGFAMETVGFGLYVVALALAPLALVQSVGAAASGCSRSPRRGARGAR